MAYVTIDDRVDRLEALFGQFLTEMALINKRAEERDKAAEERDKAAEERDKAAEERHQSAEERFVRFQDEMRAFKDEMQADRREMNQQWGRLANRLGTILEDVVAPNVRHLAREHFRMDPVEQFMIRCCRRHPTERGREEEFDVVVVGAETVLLGEARTSPQADHVPQLTAKLQQFQEYFPELSGRRVVGILGSWSIPEEVVKRLTGAGIYALQMGEETMELANAAALEGEGRQ
ncbi:MAG: hypothetical protein H7A46_18355 [Verrucomicrobiales bacterium]|nr:hypothetical protein [Verrucomicrobiales bacterium]